MLKNIKIKPPFFEIGPKAFMYGEEMLKLAKVIDKTAMKYDLDVIVTPQYTDIKLLADNTERILSQGREYRQWICYMAQIFILKTDLKADIFLFTYL